jgi:hypothetical protein
MKLLSSIIIIYCINVNSKLITPKKLCKDCKHFIADKKECALFGDMNLVTGDHNLKYASSARNNKDYCGEDAMYFETNNFKIITVPYYFIKFWLPLTPVAIIMCFYFYQLYDMYKLTHHE